MDEIAIDKGILKERSDSINVILAHFTNVLEEEGERLEHAVLHVQLRRSVLVHQRG